MTESIKYKRTASSCKWTLRVLTCGALSFLSVGSLLAQTTNRLPVIRSLPSQPGRTVLNNLEQPGKVNIGPVISPAPVEKPGVVKFDQPNQFWSPASKPGKLDLEQTTKSSPQKNQPGTVTLDTTSPSHEALPVARESEFKQRQRGTLQINTLNNEWGAHSNLPTAPPAELKLNAFNEPGEAPGKFTLETNEVSAEAPEVSFVPEPEPVTTEIYYTDTNLEQEFAAESSLSNPGFETSISETGSGKPGVHAGEEEFWISQTFAQPKETSELIAATEKPATRVEFKEAVESELTQHEPVELIPEFFVDEEDIEVSSAEAPKELPVFFDETEPAEPLEFAAQPERTASTTQTTEVDRAGFVNILLEEPVAQVRAESSPFMGAMESNAPTPLVKPQATSTPGKIERPASARKRPNVSVASYLEDFAEETGENLPRVQTVGAWFGVYDEEYFENANCECPPIPEWSFRAEALYWHRSDPKGGEPLLIRVPAMAAPGSYIGNDVDYDNELGHRYRLERMNSDGSGFDMEYFGINDWSDTVRWVEQQMFVLGTDIGAGSGAVTSDSEFYSWEVNGRRDWDPWTTFFAGFRVLVLDEYTSVSGAGDMQNVFASIDIENNLYGAQIGIDRTLFDNGGVLTIDMTFNLGVFYNSIEADTVNFPALYDNESSAASLLRELNFNMTLAVTDHMSVIGGYTLIWLDDLALGPDQFLDPNNSVNEDSNIFVHGGNLGLLFTW
ncbi:MAG: hypothetical protein KDA65_04370 [Planctomycetaceae bacterium]|nr:hypothetical protein [Planctomycetaceae bacterium]